MILFQTVWLSKLQYCSSDRNQHIIGVSHNTDQIKSSGVNMSEQHELEITWEQQWWTHCNKIIEIILIRPKKKICVFTVTCKKNLESVGRHYYFFFFSLLVKPEIVVPGSVFHFWNFRQAVIVEAVLWRVTQFFYLLCSQFRQKASSWTNKTLLLIK